MSPFPAIHRLLRHLLPSGLLILLTALPATAAGTRLVRQPTLSADHVAFVYGADLWVVDRDGGEARRLTSTPAVESDPQFSPDGGTIAFTSNRAGDPAVYVVPVEGGNPMRLTWYPASDTVRGWTPDGSRILYSSTRATAPSSYGRLWTVAATGGPSELVPSPWGADGSYAPDARRMIVDRVSRWRASGATIAAARTPASPCSISVISPRSICPTTAPSTSSRCGWATPSTSCRTATGR